MTDNLKVVELRVEQGCFRETTKLAGDNSIQQVPTFTWLRINGQARLLVSKLCLHSSDGREHSPSIECGQANILSAFPS